VSSPLPPLSVAVAAAVESPTVPVEVTAGDRLVKAWGRGRDGEGYGGGASKSPLPPPLPDLIEVAAVELRCCDGGGWPGPDLNFRDLGRRESRAVASRTGPNPTRGERWCEECLFTPLRFAFTIVLQFH